MPSKADIANQLKAWIKKWGAINNLMGDELVSAYCNGIQPRISTVDLRRNAELANFRLSAWPRQAANELESLLKEIGVDTRYGTKEAHANNIKLFQDAPPMQLIDMLTILHDLRKFGPTKTFRPEQTFEAVFKFTRAFSRK